MTMFDIEGHCMKAIREIQDSPATASEKRNALESLLRYFETMAEKPEPIYEQNHGHMLRFFTDEAGRKHPEPRKVVGWRKVPGQIGLEGLRLVKDALDAITDEAPPPFIQELIDADSIEPAAAPGLYRLKPITIEADIFIAIRDAKVSNPGRYIVDHFLKSDGTIFSLNDVRNRLAKAK